MTKKLLSLLTISATLALTFSPALVSADFSDVSSSHPNNAAINFLKETGVIKGYPDGSFKPQKEVNRAEFLKIILEGSNIKTDVEAPTGFADTSENEWYSPYLRKAFHEGWIEGYNDPTDPLRKVFKPTQSINKAEALKILAVIQKWSTGKQVNAPFEDVPAFSWFAPYVDFAKQNNLLEENGTTYNPGQPMTRAAISEVIYRSITKGIAPSEKTDPVEEKAPSKEEKPETKEKEPEEKIEEKEENATPPTPPKGTTQALNFTPTDFKTYDNDFFEKIQLNTDVPNTFYQNEVYFFEGKITDSPENSVFVFTRKTNSSGEKEYKNFPGSILAKEFSIPVQFSETGNFKLGIIPGNKGLSKIIDISVLPALPENTAEEEKDSPTNLKALHKNDRTYFSWKRPKGTISRFTIQQGDAHHSFVTRQNYLEIPVDYAPFENFTPGAAWWYVETAEAESITPIKLSSKWAKSTTQQIEVAQHHFSIIEKDKVIVNSFPETLKNTGNINVEVRTKADIYLNAAIITPHGTIETIELTSDKVPYDYFGSKALPSNSTVSFKYPVTKEGTYIIEINEKTGSALLNSPIYVGPGIPLIPDYFDLHEPELSDDPISLNQFRLDMRDLINKERARFNLQPVELKNDLSVLAQEHSQDMATKNYFGHINLQNESPEDRRIRMKIPVEVSENLAKASDIFFAHEGLMRSAIHRENILDPNWTRVGIGAVKDAEGYLLVTQEFAKEPLTEKDITELESEIMTYINDKRSDKSASNLAKSSLLHQLSQDWSTKMATENFFDFEAPDGDKLIENIQNENINKNLQVFILEGASSEAIAKELVEKSDITKSSWKEIGIGIGVTELGILKSTLLYSD